jgi:hypothetical protein
MSPFFEALVTITGGIIAVAIISVLVSRKSQTPAVIQASGSAFSNALAVAESPVTGATYNVNLSYPGTDLTGSFGYG